MRIQELGLKPLMLAAATAAVALTVVLGGCTDHGSGPTAGGPLSGGAYGSIKGSRVCQPGRIDQPRAFGIAQFTNHGQGAVVLDRVALLHARQERLIGSYAVPGTWLIGVVAWPPKYSGLPPAWKHRAPVHGFRLAAGKTFNMVLGVIATATGHASSRGMLIYYHDSSGRFVTSSGPAMLIAVNKRRCS
jgi:hypothetical protein